MRKLLCCFVFVIGSAFSASVTNTQVDCPQVSGEGAMGCSASTGAYFASVSVYPGANHYGSASASFGDDYIFTVTAGPDQGFFVACLSGYGDTYQGSDFAQASFGNSGFSSGSRFFNFSTCPQAGGGTSYTLGVPMTEALLLSVSVSTSGSTPQGQAHVDFTGFEFFDASGNPVSGVTYSLDPVPAPPVPEPSPRLLLFCGFLLLALSHRHSIGHNSTRSIARNSRM